MNYVRMIYLLNRRICAPNNIDSKKKKNSPKSIVNLQFIYTIFLRSTFFKGYALGRSKGILGFVQKVCYLHVPTFFGRFNNEIDIRQINRRKTNLILYIQESYENLRPEWQPGNWSLYKAWAKERGMGLGIQGGGRPFTGRQRKCLKNKCCPITDYVS